MINYISLKLRALKCHLREVINIIFEIKTSDFRNKCGNCKFLKTENHIAGKCINKDNKIKSWNRNRSYNSKSCSYKEVK